MIVEKSINNNERIDYSYSDNENYPFPRYTDHGTTDRQHLSNIETAALESENETNRTEPFQFGSVQVEPNSNRLLEEKTNRTELEPEKVGSIRPLNSTTCPSNGITHKKIESDGIPDRHTKKYQ
jgi:hypothetical protein